MTELRHRWDEDPPTSASAGLVQLATCRECGTRRRTRLVPGGGIPLVEYLVSGVGWTQSRPACFVPGVEQLSLLGAPPEPQPVKVHECHAFACAVPVAPRFLMCRKHWMLLPTHLRDAVNHTYQPGQERGAARPSRAWLDAVRDAITYVATMEGRLNVPLR